MAVASLALLACLTGALSAQTGRPARTTPVITGKLLDAATLAPLPGVEVLLLGGSSLGTTDPNGEFLVSIAVRGTVTLVLRRLGYAAVGVPLSLEPGDSLRVATTLRRLPQDLDTLRVTGQSVSLVPARFAAFERRRQLGHGIFITPEVLERTPSISIGDVLRGIPSIRVSEGMGMIAIESARGGRITPRGQPAPCRIRILVDGMPMPFGVPLPVTSPKQVHAIEVYSGPATMPPELVPIGEDAFCGVVAVWTK